MSHHQHTSHGHDHHGHGHHAGHQAKGHGRSGHGHGHADAGAATPANDPVCGMRVDPATSKHRAEHGGQTFHFCSAGCRTKFVADPGRYLGGPDSALRRAEPVVPGAVYTCPMHPQVRQVGPGSCPICGMALEPEVPTGEAEPNHELVDFTRRFWIGLALTVPVTRTPSETAWTWRSRSTSSPDSIPIRSTPMRSGAATVRCTCAEVPGRPGVATFAG